MSIQGDIENGLASLVSVAMPGVTILQGPASQPRVEGSGRAVSVRKVSAAVTRLAFGQALWAESYLLTVFWAAATIPRETTLLEWETFAAQFRDAPGIGLTTTHPTIERGYLTSQAWGEAADGHFRIMAAALVVERVE